MPETGHFIGTLNVAQQNLAHRSTRTVTAHQGEAMTPPQQRPGPPPASPQPTALQVRSAWETAHPEITITPPIAAKSGKWELRTGQDTTCYDDFWLMIGHLARTYGEAVT